MKNNSVLVTGCSSGIGLATAKMLKKKGWEVFTTARQDEDLVKLSNLGFQAVKLDLISSNSIHDCAEYVIKKTDGKLSAIVNNAGYGVPGAIEDLDRKSMKEQFEVNLFGTLELTNHLIPYLSKQKSARIIYVSSVVGRIALPFMGIYSASKFALEAIADVQRVELSKTTIKVSLIEPGPIGTNFSKNTARIMDSDKYSNSRFRESYKNIINKRLTSGMGADKFRLAPISVAKKIIHALESHYPKTRYKVTVPAYLGDFISRFIPTKISDFIIKKQILKRFT